MDIKIARGGASWVAGTSLQGYFTATWKDLFDLFGPIEICEWSADHKVSIEIGLKLDGTVVTIYDWKENYPPGHNPNKEYEFHIGGHKPEAVEKLKETFYFLNRPDIADTCKSFR